ncbi:MAG: transposase [Pseudomonadales bacterium]|nr:transposase [Pseudomonadales bacterium]
MPRFKDYNYSQHIMLVISLEEQLQPSSFWTIHHLISDKIDLSAFHADYCNDKIGRPAYDPALLLQIVLFAYYKGITSSRQIEWSCLNNIAERGPI